MLWWEIPLYIGAHWITWKLLMVLIKVIKSCWN
jgi:hypothetical protein